MAAIGKIEEFNLREKNWSSYIARVQQFFKANNVKSELKTAMLITIMGSEAFDLLTDLCNPEKPENCAFEDLVDLMGNHLQPKPSDIAERYKFRHRVQENQESIANFVAVLKRLAKNCNFGNTLEDNLRDQLVFGLKSEIIRQRLFTESKLTYTKAVEIAMCMESAEINAELVMKGDGAMNKISTFRKRISDSTALVNQGRQPPAVFSNSKLEPSRRSRKCRHCGKTNHAAGNCYFRQARCHRCHKVGHIVSICNSKLNVENVNKTHSSKYVNNVKVDVSNETEDIDDDFNVNMFHMHHLSHAPFKINIEIQNTLYSMEVDTGSAISAVSKIFYDKNLHHLKINKSNINLKSYNGESIHVLGYVLVDVKYKNICKCMKLYVIENGGSPLIGREWLTKLNISIDNLYNIDCKQFNNMDSIRAALKTKFPNVFKNELGTFNVGKVKLYLKDNAVPKFCKPRHIPYALKAKVEVELDKLVKLKILTPINFSQWATPIVPVLKRNGEVRICGDYKVTLNPNLCIDKYPIPKIEDLLVNLRNCKYFSKIDLSQAYSQIELDDDSKELVVINTHKGLFRYNRLPFGVASSPGIFQRLIENLFADLEGVCVFLDDILISAETEADHLNLLYKVFERLDHYGLKLQLSKCTLCQNKVEYLGFIIDERGVHTAPDKINAIVNCKVPNNITELRAFLGLVNYYSKFIPNVATKLNPLYSLLKKNNKFKWSVEQQAAFELIKKELVSSKVLVHYEPNLPLILACDASCSGIAAVISHQYTNGDTHPIAYASRSLTASERGYSQIDKEALAIIFGVKKFHQYLFGRQFTLLSDHKPLISIFGDKRGIPMYAASRLQRWSTILSTYQYKIKYIKSKDNANADALSRLPLLNTNSDNESDYSHMFYLQENLPIDHKQVKLETRNDPILNQVLGYCLHGWPDKENLAREVLPYYNKLEQLHVELGCVFWGYRIIIPAKLRSSMLKELHLSHLGVNKCKAIARSYFWWPNLDLDVEKMCSNCKICTTFRNNPPKITFNPWPLAIRPWSRLHLDFLGPIFNRKYLIIVDTYTKWIEVFELSSTNAINAINKLRILFATFGLPDTIVSDNGPPFTSTEFCNYLKINGIKQLFSPPYHPQSNGAAENAVKLIKNVIKKAQFEKQDINSAIYRFLFDYRNAPHSITGVSPAESMFGRNLRGRLDLILPNRNNDIISKVSKQQLKAKSVSKNIGIGDEVLVKNYVAPNKSIWNAGKVVSNVGNVVYDVKTENGNIIRRHSNQIIQSRHSLPFSVSSDDEIVNSNIPLVKESDECTDNVSQNLPGSSSVASPLSTQPYNLRPRK